jgi:hypothetical protein
MYWGSSKCLQHQSDRTTSTFAPQSQRFCKQKKLAKLSSDELGNRRHCLPQRLVMVTEHKDFIEETGDARPRLSDYRCCQILAAVTDVVTTDSPCATSVQPAGVAPHTGRGSGTHRRLRYILCNGSRQSTQLDTEVLQVWMQLCVCAPPSLPALVNPFQPSPAG